MSCSRKKSDFFLDFSRIDKFEFEKFGQDPDDNDGFDINEANKVGKSSKIECAIQIANAIMGAGILALPVMMQKLGIILGTCNIIIAAIITVYSVKVLLRTKSLTNQYGYSMYGKISYGNFGSFLVKFASFMTNFSSCCAYFKIFGKISKYLVNLIASEDSYFVTNERNYFYVLVLFVLMFPLIFKKSIDSFKNFSFLGVIAIFTFCISLLFLFIFNFFNGMLPYFESKWLFPSDSFMNCLAISTSVILAYTFQIITFPIYFSLKNRTDNEMKSATFLGVGFCMLIYLFSSILALIIFADQKIIDTTLENFEFTLKDPNSSLPVYITMIIVLVCFLISSTMSIPLLFFSYKYTVLNIVLFFKKTSRTEKEELEEIKKRKSYNLKNFKENLTPDDNNKQDILVAKNKEYNDEKVETVLIPMSLCEERIWTVISYILIIVTTLLIDKLEIILDIGGSTGANLIGLILPNLFLIKLLKVKFFSTNLILNKIIFLIGVFIFVVGVTFTFLKKEDLIQT